MNLIERKMLTEYQIELIQQTVPVLRTNGVTLITYFYERMLKNHPELKEVFNLGHQVGGGQAKALAHAVLAYAENIKKLEMISDHVSLIVSKHVSLNIQPEQYDIVGSNLLHSISEVLNISIESELIKAWEIAYYQLAHILISAEKTKYNTQLTKLGGWNGWRDFHIVRKEKESNVITSFYLQPKDGKEIVNYKAGQYISLRVLLPELGYQQPRQYTLSNNYNPKEYRISVKKEEKSIKEVDLSVSNALHDALHVGDTVQLSNPTGEFFLKNLNGPNVFISAGVGLTPMVSMLNTLAEQCTTSPISFIHACQNDQVLAMPSMINDSKNQLTQLKTYLACEKNDNKELYVDHIGRLDLAKLQPALLPNEADYYICGPIGFMAEQLKVLQALGVDSSKIHMERFGTGGVTTLMN